jgi:tetratricopeptide (TPR) repeat protein
MIRKDPARVDYWLLQSGAYLGMKQPLKAAQNYEALDSVGLASAQMLNTLGDIYVNESVFDLAATAYLRALDRDEQGAMDRYLRDAEVLAARGAAVEAAQLVERVKARIGKDIGDGERKRILKLDARLAATRAAGGDEQRRLLEEIVALDPLDGEALILLGQSHAGAGDVEKACFLYERAAGIEKYEAEAKLRMAQCLVRSGRYKDAVPLLKRTLELKPREDVSRYLEQVERVARTKS